MELKSVFILACAPGSGVAIPSNAFYVQYNVLNGRP